MNWFSGLLCWAFKVLLFWSLCLRFPTSAFQAFSWIGGRKEVSKKRKLTVLKPSQKQCGIGSYSAGSAAIARLP